MVEAGSIQIGGSIQTLDIEQGIKRIEISFKDLSKQGKSVEGDFERISSRGRRIVDVFSKMALIGTGAIAAITKGAPAVAGSMARMKVAAGELQRRLGEALAPAFDLVSKAFQRFVDWIEKNKAGISWFATTTLGGVLDAVEGIKTGWQWLTTNIKDFSAKIGLDLDLGEALKWIWEHFGPEIATGLAVAGLSKNPVAGLVGAGAVYAGRRIENPGMYVQEQKMGGLFGSILGVGPFDFFEWFANYKSKKEASKSLEYQI